MLPVFNFKNDLLDAIENNSVIIVRGATGCGKTTQIPQYILEKYLEKGQQSPISSSKADSKGENEIMTEKFAILSFSGIFISN